jgi:hypothetical protein
VIAYKLNLSGLGVVFKLLVGLLNNRSGVLPGATIIAEGRLKR